MPDDRPSPPTDRPLFPAVAPEGERPGAYADLPPDPPRPRLWRRPGVLAAVSFVAALAVVVGVVYGAGAGGWRSGWLIAVGLGALTGAAVWLPAGPRLYGRGMWAAAAAIVGVSVSVSAANAAPPSAGSLRADAGRMGFANQLYVTTSSSTRGHGWCVPQCPEVVRVYRAPNGSYQEALVIALAGLHRMGLVGDLKQAYDGQVGLLIVRHGRHVGAEITLSRDAENRVVVRVDLTSRR